MCSKKDLCEIGLSHDELMLKELERRDGIYSFIFHELESPKEEVIAGESGDNAPNGAIDSHKVELKPQPSPLLTANPAHANAKIIKVTPTRATGTFTTRVITSISSIKADSGSIPTSPNVNTNSISSIYFSNAGATTGISNALSNYQEYLKSWRPPPSLVYDNPKLYAYMANCGFRVRLPPPRFSHITAPLVRNRQHVLKESAEYKRCRMCVFKVPDLRMLFPHDPDVHAPFQSECGDEGNEVLSK